MNVFRSTRDTQRAPGPDIAVSLVKGRGLKREGRAADTVAATPRGLALCGEQDLRASAVFMLSSRTHNMLITHSPARYHAVRPPMTCPVSFRTFTEKEPWSALLVPVAAKLYSSSPASRAVARSGSWSPAISRAAARDHVKYASR